mgnify:CR=1 FL=1
MVCWGHIIVFTSQSVLLSLFETICPSKDGSGYKGHQSAKGRDTVDDNGEDVLMTLMTTGDYLLTIHGDDTKYYDDITTSDNF